MKITRVHMDDWEGWYINGELYDQHHSIDTRDILNKLGFEVENVEADYDFYGYTGTPLPEKLEDVKSV